MKRYTVLFWFLLSSVSTFAQEASTIDIQPSDSLFLKSGDFMLVNVLKVESSYVEYEMTGAGAIHFTSFHDIEKLVLANGQVYFPSEKSYEQERYERLGVDINKRKGQLLINSYLSSLLRRPNAQNSLVSLGAQYYFNTKISAGIAYQYGLGDPETTNSFAAYTYSNDSFINNILDFNLGWSTSNHRKFDFGIRVGYQLTDITFSTFTNIDTDLWREVDEQIANPIIHYQYNGGFYESTGSTNESSIASSSESLPKFYVGGEMLYTLSPKFSASAFISFSNSNFLDRYTDEYLTYEEFYDATGTLVDRRLLYDYGDYYYENIRLSMNCRISLSYHLFGNAKP